LIEKFKTYISQFIILQNEEYEAFTQHVIHTKINKKEIFIKENEICDKLLFFTEGYFRFFHFLDNGTEITSDFYFAPSFVTSYTSFITGNPSYVNVQAMDEMNVLVINKFDLENLYSRYPNIERLGRLLAEQVAITSEQHLFSLLNYTAEERYANMLAQYPQFVQHIPLQYIASYLGITQATLSRVRKKLK